MLYVVAEVFQNKIVIDKVNVVFKQYPNIPKHCPPADVIQAILIHIFFWTEFGGLPPPPGLKCQIVVGY